MEPFSKTQKIKIEPDPDREPNGYSNISKHININIYIILFKIIFMIALILKIKNLTQIY